MSVTDTRLSDLIDIYIDRLESPQEDVRRRATDDFYELIISQYSDVSRSSLSESLIVLYFAHSGTNRRRCIGCGEIAGICQKETE